MHYKNTNVFLWTGKDNHGQRNSNLKFMWSATKVIHRLRYSGVWNIKKTWFIVLRLYRRTSSVWLSEESQKSAKVVVTILLWGQESMNIMTTSLYWIVTQYVWTENEVFFECVRHYIFSKSTLSLVKCHKGNVVILRRSVLSSISFNVADTLSDHNLHFLPIRSFSLVSCPLFWFFE